MLAGISSVSRFPSSVQNIANTSSGITQFLKVFDANPLPTAQENGQSYFQQLECLECGGEMTIIALIRDPAVVNRILDYLYMIEISGNDPARSPPDEGLKAEPVYDHLPSDDQLVPDS